MNPTKLQRIISEVKQGHLERLPILIGILRTALRESSGPCSPIIIRAVQQVCVPLGCQIVLPANYRVIAMAWLQRFERLYRTYVRKPFPPVPSGVPADESGRKEPETKGPQTQNRSGTNSGERLVVGVPGTPVSDSVSEVKEAPASPPKRKRGRPRKHSKPDNVD